VVRLGGIVVRVAAAGGDHEQCNRNEQARGGFHLKMDLTRRNRKDSDAAQLSAAVRELKSDLKSR
jgi:hypothetical protein